MTPSFDHLQHLRVETDGGVTTVSLARPEVRNAFGPRLIEELGSVFTELSDDDATRVVVLRGDGKSFSAGADINWMRESVSYSRQENVEDATRLALMLEAIKRCDKPVVCRVHGHAIGGALGLVACSDYVVADDATVFAFSEVKLGIVPAVISPFVQRRIGLGHARALFITGERFAAARALCIGLVHVSAPTAELDAQVQRVVDELLTAAPGAIAVVKHLTSEVGLRDPREVMLHTAETIASKRTDPEGQEGLTAFLEKRRPAWMDEAHAPAWLPGAAK
jgi:methylglutaconyl-CoA hydratase